MTFSSDVHGLRGKRVLVVVKKEQSPWRRSLAQVLTLFSKQTTVFDAGKGLALAGEAG